MADFTKTTETVVFHRYTLRTPTNPAEVDKMVHSALNDIAGRHRVLVGDLRDDALTLDVTNDAIVVVWQEDPS